MVKEKYEKRIGVGIALTVVLLVVIIIACVMGTLLYKNFKSEKVIVPMPSQVKAFVIDTTQNPWIQSDATQEDIDTYLQQTVEFAVEYGYNTIVLPISFENGLPYYDSKYGSLPVIKNNGWFLNRIDALKLLCEKSNESGIFVAPLIDSKQIENADIIGELKDIQDKYQIKAFLQMGYGENLAVPFSVENKELVFDNDDASGVKYLYGFDDETVLDLYLQAQNSEFNGAILGYYEEVLNNVHEYNALLSCFNTQSFAPVGYDYAPPAQLQVTYPTDTLYTSGTYMMGTSDPSQSLTINGEDIAMRGENGVWGAFINLEIGDNEIVLQNGTNTLTHTIKYSKSSGGGSSTHSEWKTKEFNASVKVNVWITSVLSSPTESNTIQETARKGAIFNVKNVLTYNGSDYAYQLTDGNWVSAKNAEFVSNEPYKANFTDAIAQTSRNGEDIIFTGNGTPLVYQSFDFNTLTLEFVDTTLAEDFSIGNSDLVKNTLLETNNVGNPQLTINFTENLWGYSIEYENDTMKLVLRKTPVQSEQAGLPLQGVKVLLDPGHGDTDTGAMGAGGNDAPTEKNANLAVALSAKYRLEQMGAKVVLTREDDTFLTLEQRLEMIAEVQPDFFISVHHNSTTLTYDNANAVGVEAYYYYFNNSTQLAENLVDKLSLQLNRNYRDVFGGYRYYVTRTTLCPAVLLECGFMPNPVEFEDITDNTQVLIAGNAIAQSILDATPLPTENSIPSVAPTIKEEDNSNVDDSKTDENSNSSEIMHPLVNYKN